MIICKPDEKVIIKLIFVLLDILVIISQTYYFFKAI